MNLRDVLIAEKQRNNKTTATETIDNNSTEDNLQELLLQVFLLSRHHNKLNIPPIVKYIFNKHRL
jgi:hypothetical protein